ncbi:heat shock factor 2-binding protein isoform X2 [Hylobates moloch]|uniref:heat shock factor 2-binding protein isoform X2 n=1 Tax=Hylobates moloch TaxID=81572 RepID=UPI0026756532|nr:heat shock factor 2-binding protein isoform X2 [Hylobates moloch]
MGEAGAAEEACRHMGTKEEFVKVRKKDLERLTTEVMQIRDFLPRILNGEVLESFQKLKIVEKNLERKDQELEQLKMDCEHFKARLETVQADNMREKKEKLALRQQVNEVKQQLLQQAEYCTEMGAAACTLLWGVSSSEEVVKAILGGVSMDKALKFFSITGQTMESFVKSLDGDIKELDSDENQFVFALAGIVTNVAAIACGREFLVNSSRVLLDTILQLLGDLKPGQCTKLKVLMLMSLYNVSINLKGLKYISESPGFIPLLWWLLSDPDAEVCLHVLRLVQSVVLEPEVFSKSASEFRSSLPLQRILAMSKSRNPRLQTAARELLEDLRTLEHNVFAWKACLSNSPCPGQQLQLQRRQNGSREPRVSSLPVRLSLRLQPPPLLCQPGQRCMTTLSKSKQPSAAGNLDEQTPGECFCRSCFVTSSEVWKRWKHFDPALGCSGSCL